MTSSGSDCRSGGDYVACMAGIVGLRFFLPSLSLIFPLEKDVRLLDVVGVSYQVGMIDIGAGGAEEWKR